MKNPDIATPADVRDAAHVLSSMYPANQLSHRLNALADQLADQFDQPKATTLRRIAKAFSAGAVQEIEVRIVFADPEPGDLTAADLPGLLDALRQSDETAVSGE